MPSEIPKLTVQSIKPWFDREELIQDCISQLQKDLGTYGIKIIYEGKAEGAYDELFGQLQPQIQALLRKNTSLREILYRVDVDEEKVRSTMESTEEWSEGLTKLILWRELQKVVTRFLLQQDHNKKSEPF